MRSFIPSPIWLIYKLWKDESKMEPKAYCYIVFSFPEQEKGDSLRRQIQLSEEYCIQNGLILDDT